MPLFLIPSVRLSWDIDAHRNFDASCAAIGSSSIPVRDLYEGGVFGPLKPVFVLLTLCGYRLTNLAVAGVDDKGVQDLGLRCDLETFEVTQVSPRIDHWSI